MNDRTTEFDSLNGRDEPPDFFCRQVKINVEITIFIPNFVPRSP